MDSLNNYNGDSKKVRPCRNSYGKIIYWNKNENAYFEIDSQQKHVCPNWKPSINNSQKQRSEQGIKFVNTTEEILARILLMLDRLDRKLDKLGGA